MKVWIDLDNSPHAHFFAPIIRRLDEEGLEPILTVRSFSQTEELARHYGLNFQVVGDHRAPILMAARVGATLKRAAQLARFIRGKRPVAAISHGSRAHTLAAWASGIPGMALYDYEFVSSSIYHLLSRKVLVPSVIPAERVGHKDAGGKVVRYPGFKEEVYIYDFLPNPGVLPSLSLDPERVIIVVRPPASWAHYHCDRSELLFRCLMARLRAERDAQVVLLPRTGDQASALKQFFDVQQPPFVIPAGAIDALSLIHYADAVFSGGGTMSREAALLGVVAYSTFAGRLGAAASGRLKLLQTAEQVDQLVFEKRVRPVNPLHANCATREFIVAQIMKFAGAQSLRRLESSYSSSRA
jgi:predicted glycosyltransferase